jgi:L-ribulose-5-phosphate 3-epimerase
MHATSRRTFLSSAVAVSLCSRIGFASEEKVHIGAMDGGLNLNSNPEAVRMAAKLGFDGVQISFGKLVDGRMPADNPEVIARYLSLSREYRIPIDGTSMHQLYPMDPKWVLTSIRLTNALHSGVLLLPFFGPTEIKTPKDMERVGDMLRDLAPEATNAGVILGLENTLSAADSARILDRARSPSVQVFYDVGNSAAEGLNSVKEIRWLGKDRICQFHFKDDPHYLGEGSIQFPPIVQAIRDIHFAGYVNLEAKPPSGNIEADAQRNLAYVRKIMAQR